MNSNHPIIDDDEHQPSHPDEQHRSEDQVYLVDMFLNFFYQVNNNKDSDDDRPRLQNPDPASRQSNPTNQQHSNHDEKHSVNDNPINDKVVDCDAVDLSHGQWYSMPWHGTPVHDRCPHYGYH